jgi:hypothetical protein
MDKDDAVQGLVKVTHLSRESKVNANGFHYEQVNCELLIKTEKVTVHSVRYIFYENNIKYTLVYSNNGDMYSKQYIQSIVDNANF